MSFNPYRKWLGIPSQIKEPTFYDILGIHPGENDDEVIRSAIEQRRVFIQNKRGQGEDESVKTILTLIDEAASTLLVPEFKNGYDRQLGLHIRKKSSGRRKSYVLPSWMESRVVRVYGEGSGIVGDLLGIVTVLFGAFALMAWFSFSLPWSKIPKSDDIVDQPETWIEKLAEGSKATEQAEVQPTVEAKAESPVANQPTSSSFVESFAQPETSFQTAKPTPEIAAPKPSTFVSVDQAAVMKTLQGEWLCVATEENEQQLDSKTVQEQDRRIEFNGDSIKMTRTINDRASYEGKFQIESSSNGFNFVGKGPRGAAVEWLGIYELNQDTLKLCYRYNRDGTAQRPTEFKTDDMTPNNSGYYTYRRVPSSKSEGWISMFDGKTPSGWKANENPSAWKIEEGCIVATGEARSYLFYRPQDGNFRDFHFKAEIKSTNGSNSGVYFHTNYVAEGVPSKGLECQVCATNIEQAEKTGSLYKVYPIKTSPVQDDEWYTQEIIVQGKRVMHKINGVPVVDYTEPKSQPAATEKFERRLGEGLFALQSSAPAARTYFRNIQVKPLGSQQSTDTALSTVNSIEKGTTEVPLQKSIEVPKPKLYISCDPSVKNLPPNLNLKVDQNSYAKGRSGQAIKFNGKNAIQLDFQLPTGNSPRSLAVWLRNDQEPKGTIGVVNWGDNGKGQPFGIMQAKDQWIFFNMEGGMKSRVTVDRNWHHHCVTFDGMTLRYYLDASQTAFDTKTLNTVAKGWISLGGFTKSGATFVGLMDELHFFGVALSDAQVAEVMKNPYGSRN